VTIFFEERRLPFVFDDFQIIQSRVMGRYFQYMDTIPMLHDNPSFLFLLLTNLTTLGVPDKSYSRNVSCTYFILHKDNFIRNKFLTCCNCSMSSSDIETFLGFTISTTNGLPIIKRKKWQLNNLQLHRHWKYWLIKKIPAIHHMFRWRSKRFTK
jgi:hypothetical protein